ncbi:hypothetical protein BBO99_00003691 [Phytophthora kernoviae]|uniref:Uncharacterized protein n=2 Tax=Phytophthora kernoviae TaxID=325452 RepID=A0A3R7HY94_9STRA|nr:hypothetical protein G195_005219 [Phytophthora kernoviae 00238/432]KAG2523886.1 hypothetical protein JM16_003196 [Phytophthora kernoviae]KAG2525677.1 hypothetical protein JM18_003066 [Phytophthora kernoviae]RLN02596.1 hypothetical protein BBI17_003415 [Phytophthora kernoviae]RLN81448.1 hypothetical protein BBO99_00003691 [Phytophthora kernoviae]
MSWLRSKLRQVAARASDALAQAADIVAPTLYESRVEEFHHRWTTVARFLEAVLSRDLDPSEQRRLLLESHTRDSLHKMVMLIYEEENASDRMELALARSKAAMDEANEVRARARSRAQSQTPPSPEQQEHASRECLEYLLEKQVIPHLCEVGRRDKPFGIMSLAMQFVGALLSRVNYPILPTREVHVSVVALIQAAARKEVEDPVVRKCLINLLNILWKKLRGDPVQTEFFFLHADRLMIRTTDMAAKQAAAAIAAATGGGGTGNNRLRSASDDPFMHLGHHNTQSEVPELILFTGLLPHMYAIGKLGEKCREALVIAAAVHDKALCRFVLQLTPFCHYAVNGVISAFDALPKTLASTANTPAAAAAVATIESDGTMEVELGYLAVRLRFCCTLAMVARYELEEEDEVTGELQRRSIADELLDQFRSRFLEGPLLEGLLHTSEAAACAATLYARIILEELTACGRDTRANPLLSMYLQFLLESSPTHAGLSKTVAVIAEGDESAAFAEVTKEYSAAQLLPSELLRHMDSLSSSLCIATIDLFTAVLELQDDYVDSILLGDPKQTGAGQSLRSILEEVYADALRRLNRLPNGATLLQELRKKLVEDDNDAVLNDHEAETRLLCGYVVLEEILKELCSLLFARERVKTLPLKPEGYYLEPKRGAFSPSSAMQRERAVSSETFYSDDGSQDNSTPSSSNKQGSIGKEFEELLAEAESSMESLLVGSRKNSVTPSLEAELETQVV